MWKQIGVTTGGNKKEFVGMAADSHITDNVGDGSTVWLLDARSGMVFSADNTNPTTSDGWWPV